MKKITCLLLVLAMVMGLSTVAFATETTNGTGDYSANVTGSYVAGTTSNGTIFSVDVDWEGMSFTYHAEKAPVWDPVNHKYSETEKAYWEGEGTITVTNHSNAKISATPKYIKAEGYGDATLNFSSNSLKIASAESGSEQVGTITVTPDGFLPKMDAAATIGSITVTIAQDLDATLEDIIELGEKAEKIEVEWAENDRIRSEAQVVIALVNAIVGRIQEGKEEVNIGYAKCMDEYEALMALIDSIS